MSMHPKAVTLLLAGYIPMRHRLQQLGMTGFRIARMFPPDEGTPMLYLREHRASSVGVSADAANYKAAQWNDIPLDLWDDVPDKLIDYLLGETT